MIMSKIEDFLRATMENRRNVVKRLLPVIKILLQEIPFHPELREQFLNHIAKDTFDRVTKLIKSYQEKGQIIDIPPASVARLAVTSLLGFLFSRYVLFP